MTYSDLWICPSLSPHSGRWRSRSHSPTVSWERLGGQPIPTRRRAGKHASVYLGGQNNTIRSVEVRGSVSLGNSCHYCRISLIKSSLQSIYAVMAKCVNELWVIEIVQTFLNEAFMCKLKLFLCLLPRLFIDKKTYLPTSEGNFECRNCCSTVWPSLPRS